MRLITFHIKKHIREKNVGTEVIMQYLKFNVKNNIMMS